MPIDKWDFRFLELAWFISKWSKDPRTQVGAVIADQNRRIISVGFNGFPVRVRDLPERLNDKELKNELVIHGEMNAILFANRSLLGLGCSLYTYPFAPCSHCASVVVQAGIRRVVAPTISKPQGHWMHRSIERTRLVFNEARVEFIEYGESITSSPPSLQEQSSPPTSQ